MEKCDAIVQGTVTVTDYDPCFYCKTTKEDCIDKEMWQWMVKKQMVVEEICA